MTRLALPALLLSLACNPGFEPQYRVTDLRVLAVKAEVAGSASGAGVTTADPNLDQTLQLEALVVDRDGPDAAAEVSWWACGPEADGRLPPCLDPAVLADPAALARPGSGAFLVGSGARPAPLSLSGAGLPPEVRLGFQAAIDAARERALTQPTYRCRIFVELPVVVIARKGGKQVLALKRVRLAQRPEESAEAPYDAYEVNRNPLVDGAYRAPSDEDACTGGTRVEAAASFPQGRAVLCARASGAAPPDPYAVCGPDGPEATATEDYGFQWFVTGGEFPDVGGLGNAEGSHLDFDRPPGPFTLWLVLRDGRGGVAWRQVDVGPAP